MPARERKQHPGKPPTEEEVISDDAPSEVAQSRGDSSTEGISYYDQEGRYIGVRLLASSAWCRTRYVSAEERASPLMRWPTFPRGLD